jgi:hypothetical protein
MGTPGPEQSCIAPGLRALTGYGVATWLGNARWPTLLPGAGMVPLTAVLARSALLVWWRGGVRWRGTFYSTAVVRAGRRL